MSSIIISNFSDEISTFGKKVFPFDENCESGIVPRMFLSTNNEQKHDEMEHHINKLKEILFALQNLDTT
jgi:hypothetical protein